jgi:3-oxoacyl-[acyl-carrier-protein] synthase-3
MIYQMNDGGNTVSCSIPIAWKKAELEGRFKPGDKIVILGFGVGFSWCGTLLRYESI